MKTLSNSVRLIFATAVLGALASFAHAGPGSQYWQTLRSESQFKDLKVGDKIAYVCNECKTVTEVPITSHEQAMALCKDGATVLCPACKMKTKVVMKTARNDAPTHTEVTYTNAKGEECGFFTMVMEKK